MVLGASVSYFLSHVGRELARGSKRQGAMVKAPGRLDQLHDQRQSSTGRIIGPCISVMASGWNTRFIMDW